MDLQQITSWAAVGGAAGSLLHGISRRRLVSSRGHGRHLAPCPVPEVITAGLFAALAWRINGWAQLLAYSWFTAIGVSLAITDLTLRRLPNALIIPTYPVLLALFGADAIASHSTAALLRSAVAMMVTSVAFIALYAFVPGQLGGGDVKLSGLNAMILGQISWAAAYSGVLLAWLLAALGGLILRLAGTAQEEGLPLGTFLIIATIAEVMVNS